jgi:hypothetical protein
MDPETRARLREADWKCPTCLDKKLFFHEWTAEAQEKARQQGLVELDDEDSRTPKIAHFASKL